VKNSVKITGKWENASRVSRRQQASRPSLATTTAVEKLTPGKHVALVPKHCAHVTLLCQWGSCPSSAPSSGPPAQGIARLEPELGKAPLMSVLLPIQSWGFGKPSLSQAQLATVLVPASAAPYLSQSRQHGVCHGARPGQCVHQHGEKRQFLSAPRKRLLPCSFGMYLCDFVVP
jgi:hypothetical protein